MNTNPIRTRTVNEIVRRRRAAQCGFALIDLLVVMAIVAVFLAMLLPAVNVDREAARDNQCKNNLKMLGLGTQNHLNSWGFFPSAGWGWWWAGDPMRGFGQPQTGGWVYSLLPFIEQKNLWSLGQGMSLKNPEQKAKKMALLSVQAQTALAVLICPSRRVLKFYPYNPTTHAAVNVNLKAGQTCGKTDYAANCGDQLMNGKPVNQANITERGCGGGPLTLTMGDNWTEKKWNGGPYKQFTGVCYTRSEITPKDITDGLSNTYFAGDKYMDPKNYTNGSDDGDNEFATCGIDNDNVRNGYYSPHRDTAGTSDTYSWGSAHPGGCNMVYCDGSVHTVSYEIDAKTNQHFANRADGETPDWTHVSHD